MTSRLNRLGAGVIALTYVTQTLQPFADSALRVSVMPCHRETCVCGCMYHALPPLRVSVVVMPCHLSQHNHTPRKSSQSLQRRDRALQQQIAASRFAHRRTPFRSLAVWRRRTMLSRNKYTDPACGHKAEVSEVWREEREEEETEEAEKVEERGRDGLHEADMHQHTCMQ